MPPTAEEIEIGVKAYQRVRNHEKFGERNLRQAPWIVGCSLCATAAIVFHRDGSKGFDGPWFFVLFPAVILATAVQSWYAKKSIAQDRLLLRLLTEKYGDSLPWIQDEKTLAAAIEIDRAAQSAS